MRMKMKNLVGQARRRRMITMGKLATEVRKKYHFFITISFNISLVLNLSKDGKYSLIFLHWCHWEIQPLLSSGCPYNVLAVWKVWEDWQCGDLIHATILQPHHVEFEMAEQMVERSTSLPEFNWEMKLLVNYWNCLKKCNQSWFVHVHKIVQRLHVIFLKMLTDWKVLYNLADQDQFSLSNIWRRILS